MCEDNLFPEVPPVDPPAGSLVFVNVNVFDGSHDTLAEDVKVLVMDDRIQKVFTGELEGAPDHTVIDGGGRTLMPGLIDSHVHFNHTIAGGGVVALEATT
jgi:imidazolonepropionase-like amidohydrolase